MASRNTLMLTRTHTLTIIRFVIVSRDWPPEGPRLTAALAKWGFLDAGEVVFCLRVPSLFLFFTPFVLFFGYSFFLFFLNHQYTVHWSMKQARPSCSTSFPRFVFAQVSSRSAVAHVPDAGSDDDNDASHSSGHDGSGALNPPSSSFVCVCVCVCVCFVYDTQTQTSTDTHTPTLSLSLSHSLFEAIPGSGPKPPLWLVGGSRPSYTVKRDVLTYLSSENKEERNDPMCVVFSTGRSVPTLSAIRRGSLLCHVF
jgi:hypothetical protein